MVGNDVLKGEGFNRGVDQDPDVEQQQVERVNHGVDQDHPNVEQQQVELVQQLQHERVLIYFYIYKST